MDVKQHRIFVDQVSRFGLKVSGTSIRFGLGSPFSSKVVVVVPATLDVGPCHYSSEISRRETSSTNQLIDQSIHIGDEGCGWWKDVVM